MNDCNKQIIENIHKNISYQLKKKNYCIDITHKMLSNSSYLGITVDIIGGLQELKKVYTSLMLPNIINNPKLNDFYITNRIVRNDLLNFEIIWSYQSIFFPIGLDTLFKNPSSFSSL